MADANTFEYYSKRENQARELADAASAASAASVRTIHLDMADRYAKLKSETEQSRSRLTLFKEP